MTHDLSNLRVTATITGPDNERYDVLLADSRLNDPHSGLYEGYITLPKPGRYQGIIRIANQGKAIIAQPLQRMINTDADTVSVRADVPKFVRRIPLFFDVGKRPEPKDEERSTILTYKILPLILVLISIISIVSSVLTWSWALLPLGPILLWLGVLFLLLGMALYLPKKLNKKL